MRLMVFFWVLWVFVCDGRGVEPDWRHLNATELSKLDPADFVNITAGLLSSIPSEACSGFSSQQVASIPGPAVGGFGSQCLGHMTEACAGFSALGVAHLAVPALAGISKLCMAFIPPHSASGWNATQLAYLGTIDSPTAPCRGFTAEQLLNILPAEYAGFGAPCLQTWNESCSGMNSGVSYLPVGTVEGIREECMASIPAAVMDFWSVEQISHWNGCGGLRSEQMGALSAGKFSGFTAKCLGELSGACSNISGDALSNLRDVSVEGIKGDCMKNIPPESFSAWIPMQITFFSREGCMGLLPSQMEYFSGGQIQSLRGACISSLEVSTLNGLSSKKIKEFSSSQCVSFTSNQVSNFTKQTILNFELYQLGNFSLDGISGFDADKLSLLYTNYERQFLLLWGDKVNIFSIPTILSFKSLFGGTIQGILNASDPIYSALQQINWIQLSALQNTDITHIMTSSTLPILTPTAIWGLRTAQLSRISPSLFAAITDKQLSQLLSDTISELSPSQFAAIPPAIIPAINDTIIPFISVLAVKGMLPNQLTSMTCSQVHAFTEEQKEAVLMTNQDVYQSVIRGCDKLPPSGSPLPTYAWIIIGVSIFALLVALAVAIYTNRKRTYKAIG